MRLIVIIYLLLIIGSCKTFQSDRVHSDIYQDAFIRAKEHFFTSRECKKILLYKYLTKTSFDYSIDTIKEGRKLLDTLGIVNIYRPTKVSIMDEFLNTERNKFRYLFPDCGLIFSEINGSVEEEFFIHVLYFSSSMLSDEIQIRYKIMDNKAIFLGIEKDSIII